jgi:hypothetical protein
MSEKRYLIEVIGGDADGRTFDSQSPDATERKMVECLVFMTHDGKVGSAFHGVSMGMEEALWHGKKGIHDWKPTTGTHKYTVVERIEEGNEVLIRLQYSVRPLEREPGK